MEFVAYCGDDRVGKSQMAKSLQRLLHQGCKRRTLVTSFSDALRNELVALYGLPETLIFDKTLDKNNIMITLGDYPFLNDIEKLWNEYALTGDIPFCKIQISLRELFITHGTRLRRQQNPLYWTEQLDKRIKKYNGDIDVVVIDDPRDPDDFEFLLEKKAALIHLRNEQEREDNLAQRTCVSWIQNNQEKIYTEITLPIPVLEYVADKKNIEHVLPKILPRRKKQKIYFDWGD